MSEIEKENARTQLEDAVAKALEAGFTPYEVEEEVELAVTNYQQDNPDA